MIETSAIQLSQLLITKLCHDIVGPIGAINNGIEFLQEADGMEKEAISLITDSSSQAISRIQFYRYLYGMQKEQESVNLDDKKSLAESFYAQSKVRLEWHDTFHTKIVNIPPEALRIACNLILIAAASLVRGGLVIISFESNNELQIKAVGTHVILHENVQSILRDENIHAADTSNVQVVYTKMLIAKQHGMLKFNLSSDVLELHYVLAI